MNTDVVGLLVLAESRCKGTKTSPIYSLRLMVASLMKLDTKMTKLETDCCNNQEAGFRLFAQAMMTSQLSSDRT